MMLGVQGLISNSTADPESGGGGGLSGGEAGVAVTATSGFNDDERTRIEEGERIPGGNRWPRQETMALLKIREDMDVVFRDSSLKGPLWEDVSRKMGELGYHRSAKKCKEKFENVYKYHKRTREGRASKPNGKTYRFFDQLEALENHPLFASPPPQSRPQATVATSPMVTAILGNSTNPPIVSQVTVPSTTNPQNSTWPPTINTSQTQLPQLPTMPNPIHPSQVNANPLAHPNKSTIFLPNSTSSSTSSDEESDRQRKRKRKWKDFFETLMKEVVDKQEELQKKFLDTLEKGERDRMAREEAWRVQEMARMNRDHDLLVQERSIAAAKDAAVIAFLQKITDQQSLTNPTNVPQIQVQQVQLPETPMVPSPQQPPVQQTAIQQTQLPPPPQRQPTVQTPTKALDTPKTDNNGGRNFLPRSSSRWPKAEVEALIKLRTNLDLKYEENGPKGPLWEEISGAMRKLGYNRNAKRCKEKWENINKYFKKVKESHKKRPEDSKTCPYFHQLDALYKERAKSNGLFNSSFATKPEANMVPIMARPEQQWPLPQDQHQPDDPESENMDQNHDEDNGDDDDDDDDEDDGGDYQIVTNNPSSVTTTVD